MSAQADQETHRFQAEVVQILDLMIHSLYSNKEIFLRELISNASDAIDRLRFEIFMRPELDDDEGPLQIRVAFDAAARAITVSDNGIGMSRAEVIENIGTIAKSGTREFLQALTGDQRKDAALIGQFGVGFYSSFVVADRVTVITRRAGLPAGDGVRWESDGSGEYTLEPVDRPARGTEIVLHLRDGEDDLLSGYRLRSIIQKYSDHISLPILMAGEEPGAGADAGQREEAPVNRASALWARPKSEISDQDYNEFYKHIAGDIADPLAHLHSKIEGTYEYTLLLFIPSRAPWDLWMPESRRGVKLHVRRVFILEDTGQLLPRYLRFVRGVIDSGDLPLNVSRELLQGSRAVDHIRSTAVKRVLKLLKDLAENQPDKYATFWKEFGTTLKEGIVEDYASRDEIARLARFSSTASAVAGEQEVSLGGYVARMKEGQEKIYYLIAPTPAAASASPHLEAFRRKGVEVLLLTDAVDNWVVTSLPEFDGRRLQSVTQGSPDFGALQDEAERQAAEQAAAEFAGLVGRLKAALDGQAWDVRVTTRLTTSPACIVANEPDTELSLAHRLRGSGLPAQPVLEINPEHPLVSRLSRDPDDPHLAEWAKVLYGQAVLTLGARIDDPAAFAAQLNELLVALTGGPDGRADDARDRPAEDPGNRPAGDPGDRPGQDPAGDAAGG
jgi:molecular chaperone HtpG